MKSTGGGHSEEDDDDADDGLESTPPLPTPPAKGAPGSELDDFDEEDFDDEFDDDFEEELEDEYELAEFTDVTDDDLAEDEDADVTAMGDFVDEGRPGLHQGRRGIPPFHGGEPYQPRLHAETLQLADVLFGQRERGGLKMPPQAAAVQAPIYVINRSD